MAATTLETVSVKRVRPDTYTAPPYYERARIGNPQSIAYGGQALSQSVTAAFHSLPVNAANFQLYSLQGSYLGPASTDLETTFVVQAIRTTRKFCTRQVIASQRDRNVLIALLEFHDPEEPFMEYSCPEFYGRWDTWPTAREHARGVLPPERAALFEQTFGVLMDTFDSRWNMNTMAAQTVFGMAPKGTPTPQDKEILSRRTNSGWVRCPEDVDKTADKYAICAYLLDSVLAFLPLSITSRPLTAAAAVATLDFSLRFHRPPDLSRWCMTEQHTENGAFGRTYSICKLYDEDLTEIAVMSQTCILRPHGHAQRVGAKL